MSKKNLTITINASDEKFIKHIMGAFGLVNHYKGLSKLPAVNLENWAMSILIEGSNQIYGFHNEQVKKHNAEMDKNKEGKDKA